MKDRVWILVCAVVVLGVAAIARSISVQGAVRLLEQPTTWVPFEAQMQIGNANDESAQIVAGKYYRSSNGSSRLETGPADGSPPKVISIRNIGRNLSFTFTDNAETWRGNPLKLGPEGWVPKQWRSNSPLRPHNGKLALRPGQDRSSLATDGFAAYRYTDASGTVLLMAPELNFFPLVRTRPDGMQELYYDVVVREPASSLFEPPAGVEVAMSEEPDGIVHRERGER